MKAIFITAGSIALGFLGVLFLAFPGAIVGGSIANIPDGALAGLRSAGGSLTAIGLLSLVLGRRGTGDVSVSMITLAMMGILIGSTYSLVSEGLPDWRTFVPTVFSFIFSISGGMILRRSGGYSNPRYRGERKGLKG